jgi:hypothetical protein
MFKLPVIRSPKALTARSSPLTEKHYDAFVVSTIHGIEMSFATSGKQRGSGFYIPIGPQDFEKLAKEMMTTNPEAAVRAFGAALQEVPKIPKTLRG